MSDESPKGALIEKIVFAAVPIMFTCIVYLLSALQSLTMNMEKIREESALARAANREEYHKTTADLDKRITLLERGLK
jgi:choline-glycine betaine transporter